MTKKLFIKTYGCQMNVYDSIKMQELLDPFGFESTNDMSQADMVILNTCHIREKASEKMYSELGRVKKTKDKRLAVDGSDMIIVVAGCVAQAEGEEIFARAPYVDIIVGPQSYHTLPELVAKLARSEKHLIDLDFIEEEKFDNLPKEYSSQGTSAFISIQEGCDKFCTFCVVPYTRGPEFSRSPEEIYREAISLVAKGAKEIHLLGQNVNAYHGKSLNSNGEGGVESDINFTLTDLIHHISSIKGLERIRYITSHPKDMTDDLINIHGRLNQLMPFLHLPVQSGSDKILKMMNRKHTRAEYFAIIDKLRAVRPDIALSSDFIVGFPGETDEDFADTMDLVKKVRYSQCYSFKYSPRPGTPAAIKEQVPEAIKTERLVILQNELFKQQLEFNESCVGKILPVLFQKEGKHDHHIVGKTPYMQSAYVENFNKSFLGQIVNVKITKALAISVTGEVV
jgi:tRNA-2-methylthio-N6-dimethylallyladenosine synthase